MPNNKQAWHIHKLVGSTQITILNMPFYMKSVQMYWKIINMEMNLWELAIHLNILRRIAKGFVVILYSPWSAVCLASMISAQS